MPQWNSKDDMLNDLYDHVFGDEDPDEDDEKWFEHLTKFFDDENEGENKNEGQPHRRLAKKTPTQSQNKTSAPRRKRRTGVTGGADAPYGNSAWFK